MSRLPPGWRRVALGELGRWCGGGTPSKQVSAYWKDGDIPWISPKDMKCDVIDTGEDFITQAAVDGSATQVVSAGSILVVTRSGILRRTLPVAVTARDVAINQDLKALTPRADIDPFFLARQLQLNGAAVLAQCAKSGTTVDSVDFDRLKQFTVVIAPVSEQRRIVAEMDSLLRRTKTARTELVRVPRLVEHFKEAVLESAFTGGLTVSWRAKAGLARTSHTDWPDAWYTAASGALWEQHATVGCVGRRDWRKA